ncbi:MAG: hypothetical protein JWN03_316 [Nocardia sp.]|uniref:DUF6188 family protein n=1 Tax=Nocardia sp. TaxID=1821 RepID=UPI00262B55E6|nr:DUF6188 family protein [Nocardia sp.]MCU1640041.1 hypothetical protein [Nocardia sp.]
MDLPITGERLTVLSPGPFVLVLGAGAYEIHIEGELVVHRPDAPALHHVIGEPLAEDLAATLDGVIVSAAADSSGALRILLDSSLQMVVEFDRYYEAWHVTVPGIYLVVCMPGGELAIWSEKA